MSMVCLRQLGSSVMEVWLTRGKVDQAFSELNRYGVVVA